MTDKKELVVLIVESEHALLATLQDELESSGMRVEPATQAQEALRKIRHNPPDVILLDITVSDMDGLQFLKQVRSINNAQRIPIIILANIGEEEVAREALKLGAVSYLVKTRFTPRHVQSEIIRATGISHTSQA